ncbi:hypothetical protein AC18_5418 [Escherichia coli 2-222-05_S3_C2]|nr:hypothetical protein AC45_5837 [Escherichia coli 2-210-07_S3_C3]KEN91141.1 hypothetical protein AC18_5418 [Escherichia coli 2-222-05_S3_C2]
MDHLCGHSFQLELQAYVLNELVFSLIEPIVVFFVINKITKFID